MTINEAMREVKRKIEESRYGTDTVYALSTPMVEALNVLIEEIEKPKSCEIEKIKIIDRSTGKEPTMKAKFEIASKGFVMTEDIDQFYIGEDGSIILLDDAGNAVYCNTDRFKAVVYK